MMYPEKKVILGDGASVVLRATLPGDAAQMLDFLKRTAGESDFLIRYPDEATWTLEEEEGILQAWLDSPRNAFVSALMGEELVAHLSVRAHGERRKVRHRASLGLVVRKDHWGQGLGSLLMQEAILLAKGLGFEQLELEVFSGNQRAIALYERFGFEAWGAARRAFRLADGSYQDDVRMGLIFTN